MNTNGIISTLIYSGVGVVLFIIGYYFLALLLKKYNLNKAIEEQNFAAGIALAGFLIAVGIVVSGAIQ